MSRNQIWLALIGGFASLPVAAVLALWAYKSATTPVLHPDARQVPSVTRSGPSGKWAGAVERGRQIVRADLCRQNLPALSVAVGIDGDIVWAEGFGYANLENKAIAKPETLFRVADASKPLTSAGVGLLLEQNKLNLNDEIQVYVPEFPRKPWPVTLRQLMAQVAGVRSDGDGGETLLSADVANDEARLVERCRRTVDGLRMDNFVQRDLLFEPGTKYRPSSYGWIVVSAAIEAAANQPFFAFMRTRVFEPLGMRDTTIDVSTEAMPERAAFYFPKFGLAQDTRYGPKPARRGDFSCYAGAAAFLSTPSDLVRFGMGFNSGALLKPDTVQLLQAPQQLASGEETGYGLGWELETASLAGQPARIAGHGSKEGFTGASTSLMTVPGRRLVVAVMANMSFADTKSVALSIAQAFAGAN